MLKDNNHLTDALVQLINAMPESEREKIAHLITKRKRRTKRKEKDKHSEKKNYDLKIVTSLLSKIKKKKIFQKIENPSEWQKQARNEWE